VYATDGYSTITDEFTVRPMLFTIIFVINYLVMILSPIGSIVGLIAYRI